MMKINSILSLLFLFLSPLATAFPLGIPSFFSKRDLTATTQNDLVNGTPCKALLVIFARGTTAPGNVGDGTGPKFFQAIAAAIGVDKLAVQGVNYSADIFGFLAGGDKAGSETMRGLVEKAVVQCPTSKVVMSGYSQGAQVVHNAAAKLTAATAAKVNSVMLFGDPFNGKPVGAIPASKVKTFCHNGDNICEGGILVLAPHRNYTNDATEAAAFVVSKAGL